MNKNQLTQITKTLWEIPAGTRDDMRVPARVYADERLLEAMLADDTLTQLMNVTTLPGVTGCVYGMPDMHVGYGFPVGGVAATAMPHGVVSPGGVGFDINCGVRLLTAPISRKEIGNKASDLVNAIGDAVPPGVGKAGPLRLGNDDLDRVFVEGSRYVVETHGMGLPQDVEHTESRGCLSGAIPKHVSSLARNRGRDQLGTMGSGNHFVECQVIDKIFDEKAAEAMGLRDGQVTFLIHSGSRGLGHQVCTDYVKSMDMKLHDYGITLPDRQLSCAPCSSQEGQAYLGAMACAANFAWTNRQLIAHAIRQAVVKLFKKQVRPEQVRQVYDVAHNIAKMEEYEGQQVCVHRKGATRAFGPTNLETPDIYQGIGQPVFIPGSMGTCSYVMAGRDKSSDISWGSACHGAGRALSRTAAKKKIHGADLRRQLEAQGIIVRCPSNQGLAEEAPFAYKDVERVAEVVEKAGIANRVARLKPFGVIKG